MIIVRTALVLLLLVACAVAPPGVVAQEASAKGQSSVRSYTAKGDVDPTIVRQVVDSLGTGRYVSVRNRERKMNGRIIRIGNDGFMFKPDRGAVRRFRSSPEMDIAYGDVLELKKRMTKTTEATIALGVVVGVLVLVATTVSFD